jgi:murein DD-endopeptidase MepM/ murein hydrolase activator NlpD
VTRFQKIALPGNSGLSTGPHLHYEVLHDGVNLDPAQYIFNDSNLFNNTAN